MRYKFSNCLNDNQHHHDLDEYNTNNAEDFAGIGIDVSVVNYPVDDSDVIIQTFDHKSYPTSKTLNTLLDTYQSYIFN